MTDTVTSSAVATGDVAALRAREHDLSPLFRPAGPRLAADPEVVRALDDVVDTPTIGAVAAVEMARIASGWTVAIGAGNGLGKYQAFAAALVNSGWFTEVRTAATVALPDYDLANHLRSVEAIVTQAHPELAQPDRRALCRALVVALGHALGPDGIPYETATADTGLLGKPEVLERRVTTVTSNVLGTGDAPAYAMTWRTETFVRTKDGKDEPKAHTDRDVRNHRLRFNLERWRTGDRSALLEYFRHVDDWLDDFNSTSGRMKSMACFAPILGN